MGVVDESVERVSDQISSELEDLELRICGYGRRMFLLRLKHLVGDLCAEYGADTMEVPD